MIRRGRIFFLSFLTICLLISCSKDETGQTKHGNIRNVILIAIDTLRTENLGFMGYDRGTTPFLDEFSNRCVIFDRAYAPRALTLPAFASLLSGIHVLRHGVVENGVKLPEEMHLLARDFKKAGFVTLGFPAAEVISSKYNINRGFDFYSKVSGSPGAQIPGKRIVDAVRRFLQGNPANGELSYPEIKKPVFLFIHFFDTHTPYHPTATALERFADPKYKGPFDGGHEVVQKYNREELELNEADLQHARDRYDAEIYMLDGYLRELFKLFEESGLMDNSLLVFTADHGENLGEHHALTHGRPYEDALHIPLMFYFPDEFGAGLRIDAPVEITDILPTAMDIAGVTHPLEIDGRNILPLMENPESSKPVRNYLLAQGGKDNEGNPTYSLFDGTHRLTRDLPWSETSVLFDIVGDPHETTDIAADNPDLVELMESIIDLMVGDYLDSDTGVSKVPLEREMDPETEEMLRSLGYLN